MLSVAVRPFDAVARDAHLGSDVRDWAGAPSFDEPLWPFSSDLRVAAMGGHSFLPAPSVDVT